jgi:short-subunit dehydrogenase
MSTVTPDAFAKRYALITGATSGIGFELARYAAGDSYNLILVARTSDRLESIAEELKTIFNVEVHTITKDLFQPGAAKEIFDETEAKGYVVEMLINNAGQGQWGPFTHTELDREIDLVHLNIIAVMSLCKYYGTNMAARGGGRILNLASSLAKTPTPLMAVYAATKAFVLSFSEALAEELKDTGVTVTSLLPYATDTDFFHKAQAEDTDMYRTGTLSDPAEVAKAGYDGVLEGSMTVVPGVINKLNAAMNVLSPDSMVAGHLHKLMKPSDKEDGRKHTKHEPSAAVRKKINEKTGNKNGDYDKHKGHEHEDSGKIPSDANRF